MVTLNFHFLHTAVLVQSQKHRDTLIYRHGNGGNPNVQAQAQETLDIQTETQGNPEVQIQRHRETLT